MTMTPLKQENSLVSPGVEVSADRVRKAYRAPQVTSYGPLVRLTNGTSGAGPDGGTFLLLV